MEGVSSGAVGRAVWFVSCAVLPPVLTQLLQSVIFGMRGGFVPLDLFQVQLDSQQRRSPLCGYLFAL